MDPKKTFTELKELGKEITTWNGISALLGWDQETYMPEKAVIGRSQQHAAVDSLLHEKITAKEIGLLLDKLGASDDHPMGDDKMCSELTTLDRAFIRHVYRSYSREIKLPASLVKELSETTSLAQAAWAKARQNNDFPAFQPWLEKVVDLKLQSADALGYKDHPYDPMLDMYEPNMKTAEVDQVFSTLKAGLVPLFRSITEAEQVDNSFLTKHYPAKLQEQFGHQVLDKFGYPMDRGRLDVSAHPFTTEISDDDVRITTRYLENFFNSSLFSIIHEAGHGFYELGMGDDVRGNMLAGGTSLGIHESQSRTWENVIGRSREFWQHFLPSLKTLFPENLKGIDLDTFWRGINKVESSFIRVEADEVTYNLHVILRFELEKAIISRQIAVKDLPEAWNEGMRDMLGIVPSVDSDGVLQDVHWSFGLFGYFPTYTLGNLYSAQFWNAMLKDLPETYTDLRAGKFASIHDWLHKSIYRHGSSRTAAELAVDISGETLNSAHFMDYLNKKYRSIYSLS